MGLLSTRKRCIRIKPYLTSGGCKDSSRFVDAGAKPLAAGDPRRLKDLARRPPEQVEPIKNRWKE
jgi:hypothetical protein